MSDASVTDDLEALFARIAARTEALRTGADAATGDTPQLLLADLTRAAARLRADATALGQSLAALDPQAAPPEKTREEP